MPLDGLAGTAAGGLALLVFGIVLIRISLNEHFPVLLPHNTPSERTVRSTTWTQRSVRSTHREHRTPAEQPTDPTETDQPFNDPEPSDDHAYHPTRYDPTAGDALLLQETAHDTDIDDWYSVAAITARCTQEPPTAPRTPAMPAGYVTAFTGTLDFPALKNAA